MKRTTMIATAALTAGLMFPVPAFAAEQVEQAEALETSSVVATDDEGSTLISAFQGLFTNSDDEAADEIVTGWTSDDEGWHYLDENGERVTGWYQIDGTWYLVRMYESNGSLKVRFPI